MLLTVYLALDHFAPCAKKLRRITEAFDASCITQIYPDEGHGLSGSLGHLFFSTLSYLDDCMGPFPDWFSYKCEEEGICHGPREYEP